MSTGNLPVVPNDPQQPVCSGVGCAGKCNQETLAKNTSDSNDEVSANEALLEAPDQVLSTLDKDGSRRWLRPKLSRGLWWHRRRIVAYVLMVIFVVVPHLRIGGEPLIRLDIISRKFTLFGHTFLPTDTLLVALLMLLAFVSVVFVTAVMGRAWCGWACPQTVYIEYLFRPIDRLFNGTIGKGGKPKQEMGAALQIARFLVYLLLTSILAHTLLAYFVGTDNLARWLLGSPFDHPVAFAVMAVTTGLLTYDFFYFREQTCMIACPYGRFQSVMLDRHSLIVAYDEKRGEPRKKGKRTPGVGDCLDCHQCVVVCPTGIDIRNGLQMECINCTQCIDVCDDVMEKAGLEKGLIRYTSQEELSGKPWKLFRARTFIYPVVLTILAAGFLYAASTKYSFDARVIRARGAPFTRSQPRIITNTFNLRLVNRSDANQKYELKIVSPEEAKLEVIEPKLLSLEADESNLVPIQIHFPTYITQGDGNQQILLEISDESENQQTLDFVLLGPR